MKQIKILEQWAESLLNEATQPPSTKERPIPVQKDILYKATQKYPGYSQEQALTLWMADQMAERQQTDLDQNKLINAQRKENDRLKDAINDIGNELHQHERTAQDTEREIQRLRDLSAKLKPAGEITKQAAKIGVEELQKLEQRVNSLQDKPGVDSQQLEKLNAKVREIGNIKGITPEQMAEVSKEIERLQQQDQLSQQEFNKVQAALDAKEKRFQKYIEKKGIEFTGQAEKHSGEIKKYADIVNKYKDDIKSFEYEMKNGRKAINDEVEVVRKLRGDLQQELDHVQAQADEVNQLMKFIRHTSGAPQAQDAINKAQVSSRTIQQPAQSEIPQEPQSQQLQPKRRLAGIGEPTMNEETKMFLDDVRVSRHWQDPDFNEWMNKHLPVLVQNFKRVYKAELEKKKQAYRIPYSDKQIAYTIEDHAQWLDDWFKRHDDEPLTKEALETFYAGVKAYLFDYPPEPETPELFGESLTQTYENMLDELVDSCFTKNTSKK